MILLIFLTLLQQILAQNFPFAPYTHVSKTFDGSPCLTGCDSNFECVINWNWEKRNCRIFEVAPIYLTSKIKEPSSKYCLGNCGYFGESYEWCITTTDLKWDYCSSLQTTSFSVSSEKIAQTRFGTTCKDKCNDDAVDYYWCYYVKDGQTKWEYCAPPALPRIPVLRDSFNIGKKTKGNCDGLLKYIDLTPNTLTASDAADDYVMGLADAIEGTEDHTQTQVFQVSGSAIEKYAMVKIKNMMVPAVIRARITNETVGLKQANITEEVRRKLREQMDGTTSSYEPALLIGGQLGGPSAEYNVVPRSVFWHCEEWWDMEYLVKDWCVKTGGSVDMTVVIFYKDANTPIPKAFGVSLVFKNDDNSVLVDCREKIHYNEL